MKRALLVSAFAASVAAAGTASADEDTGFYLGAGAGISYLEADGDYSISDLEDREFDVDDDDFGYKIFAGWQFLPFLAIEAGYVDFGEVEDQTANSSVEVSADGIDVFAVGILPVGFIDLFAKVGFISYDADATVDDIDAGRFDVGDDGEELAYGVGAAFELGSLSIRGEYELFDVEGVDDLSMLTVSAVLQF